MTQTMVMHWHPLVLALTRTMAMLATIINAFYLTIELWAFLGILLTALVIESIIKT